MKQGPQEELRAMISGPARLNAKAALEEKITRLRDEANRLEVLLNELPDLSHDADEGLWKLVISRM